jgi:hypothetical protein
MPQSYFDPTRKTTVPRRKNSSIKRSRLLYTSTSAHEHNPHTTVVQAKKSLSAQLSSLRESVNNVQRLNELYFPQQEAAAREKAKILHDELKSRQMNKLDTVGKAQVIQTLMEMNYFFSDFTEGGLFVTQSGNTLREASNLETMPLFFVAETLERVFKMPNILKEVPPLEFAHQLTGSEDAYFDKHACRMWLNRIQVLLAELIQPILRLPKLVRTFQMRNAWVKLVGNPMQRALNLARLGRLFWVLNEHRLRIDRLSMNRVWKIWKPMWLRSRHTVAIFTKRRTFRCLENYWILWQSFVLKRRWESINETKIDIGWRMLRDIIIKHNLKSRWNQWTKFNIKIRKRVIVEKDTTLLYEMFYNWVKYVQYIANDRKRLAASMLLKYCMPSSSQNDNIRMADILRRSFLIRNSFSKWRQWLARQCMLKNMVLKSFERMASNYIGMAFLFWKRRMKKYIERNMKKNIKGNQNIIVPINYCHMCDHVNCPPACRYGADLKKMRSQWRHIEL